MLRQEQHSDASAAPRSAQIMTHKSRELFACTIRQPRFAYAQLEMVSETLEPVQLDALQVRSYCSAALRQFLGDTGAAIATDVLAVRGAECWLRVPSQDLAAFCAAITAFPGSTQSGEPSVLRIRACGNWLGTLLGHSEQQRLWDSL